VPLNVEETDLSKLKASILAPSGNEEPCELKRLDNGQTGCELIHRLHDDQRAGFTYELYHVNGV